MQVDHHPVVQPERVAERIKPELQSTIQVTPIRCFEKECEIDAEKMTAILLLELGLNGIVQPRLLHNSLHLTAKCARGFAEHSPFSHGHVLVVDAGRKRQIEIQHRAAVLRVITAQNVRPPDRGNRTLLAERMRDVANASAATRSWAADCPDIAAACSIRSWARGEPRIDSNLDLIVVCEAPERYIGNVKLDL